MQHMEYTRHLTMGYPEYAFATGLAILSTLTMRKVSMKLSTGEIRPNLLQTVLGLSSISKKSTITKQVRTFIHHLQKELLLPGKPASTSAFYQSIEGRRRCGELIEFQGQGVFYRDEAGALLDEIRRSSAFPGMKDAICEIYDGNPIFIPYSEIGKKNDARVVDIPNPYVNFMLVTTPDRFAATTRASDVSSGFLVRSLFYLPLYNRDFKWIGSLKPEDRARWGSLMSRYETLRDIFLRRDGFCVDFQMTEKTEKMYNLWLEFHHKRLQKQEITEGEREHFARISITVLKLAMLFQIGEPKFVDDVDRGLTYCTIDLDPCCLSAAIKLADEFYLPTALYVMSQIGKDEDKNLLDKVMGALTRSGGMLSQREIMRKTHIETREKLHETVKSLQYAGEIVKFKDDKGRIFIALTGHPDIPKGVTCQEDEI